MDVLEFWMPPLKIFEMGCWVANPVMVEAWDHSRLLALLSRLAFASPQPTADDS